MYDDTVNKEPQLRCGHGTKDRRSRKEGACPAFKASGFITNEAPAADPALVPGTMSTGILFILTAVRAQILARPW